MKPSRIKVLALLMVLIAGLVLFSTTASAGGGCGPNRCLWYSGGATYCYNVGQTVCTSSGVKLICDCSGSCGFIFNGFC